MKQLYYIILILSFCVNFPLKSQTNTWNGSTDADWHKACNWSLNTIPTCAHSVVIPNTANKPNVSGIAHSSDITIQSSLGARVDITGTGRLDVGQAGGCTGTPTDNGGCVAPNLLPNPSFEDRSCCPSGLGQMGCVDFWINASSGGSTDYYNCAYTPSSSGSGYPDPSTPLPDGTGYLGFLDIRTILPVTANRKEYAGVCLFSPLTNGQSYTFEFYIANSNGSRAITVAIYGNTSCAAMPNASTDCPTTWGTGWVEMGSVAVASTTSWSKHTISFTATGAYQGFIVGSNCTPSPNPGTSTGLPNYFYLDSLALY